MKLTLNWLREFVDLPTDDPAEIAEVLAHLGLEVETVETLAATFQGVIIGKVLEVAAHPNADKVRVCQVDIGGEVSEIICGAWNFDAGAVVPVAVPGAVLGGDFKITSREIRGVVSHGMICSESELGLGDDHDGIMVLNDEYPHAGDSLGEDFGALLSFPDVAYDLSITPNRPDWMSVVGVARDLAAYYELPLKSPAVHIDGAVPASSISLRIEDVEACPRFAAREVRGVTVGRSPLWMRMRLQAAGVRPISNVVDASNYAMIELGHPTHAFDLDRLGNQLVIRRATAGETIVTLDDVRRDLVATDIVVCDADKPVAIAGVMGGASTEVHDETRNVLIEAAYWHPPSIMLTAKRLSLRSEASARFERGMDPEFCQIAADRVAELLVAIAGGDAATTPLDEYPLPAEPATVTLHLSEVERILGVPVDSSDAAGILRRLDFEVDGSDPLTVTAPTRRPDVSRPVDLIEELARLKGFDAIPDRVAFGPGGGLGVYDRQLRLVREVMVGMGYHEAMTFSFIGDNDLDRLDLPDGDVRRDGIPLVNPLRDEEGVMRTTLLPGLLKGAANNLSRRIESVALFEVGKVFLPGDGPIPDQPDMLGFVAAGPVPATWLDQGRERDVFDATGTWERLGHALRLDSRIKADRTPSFHPERAGAVVLDGVVVGHVGEISPRVAAAFGLSGRVIAGELDLTKMLGDQGMWQFAPPSPYPPIILDLAFEVDEGVPAGEFLTTVKTAAGPMLENLELFDVFQGGSLADGRKSLAIRLVIRDRERTLTDEDVLPMREAVEAAVSSAHHGILRDGR